MIWSRPAGSGQGRWLSGGAARLVPPEALLPRPRSRHARRVRPADDEALHASFRPDDMEPLCAAQAGGGGAGGARAGRRLHPRSHGRSPDPAPGGADRPERGPAGGATALVRERPPQSQPDSGSVRPRGAPGQQPHRARRLSRRDWSTSSPTPTASRRPAWRASTSSPRGIPRALATTKAYLRAAALREMKEREEELDRGVPRRLVLGDDTRDASARRRSRSRGPAAPSASGRRGPVAPDRSPARPSPRARRSRAPRWLAPRSSSPRPSSARRRCRSRSGTRTRSPRRGPPGTRARQGSHPHDPCERRDRGAHAGEEAAHEDARHSVASHRPWPGRPWPRAA